jgi:hypothetical protein
MPPGLPALDLLLFSGDLLRGRRLLLFLIRALGVRLLLRCFFVYGFRGFIAHDFAAFLLWG